MGIDGTYGLIPTPDSTEELQVLISPFSAQYGQSGGGAILTTTKSGTNGFHGTAFESYSSQNLNALGFFTAPGTVIQPSYFHYFGGAIGGPVIPAEATQRPQAPPLLLHRLGVHSQPR